MTIRDYFAAAAMQGMLANGGAYGPTQKGKMRAELQIAYLYADEAIDVRKPRPKLTQLNPAPIVCAECNHPIPPDSERCTNQICKLCGKQIEPPIDMATPEMHETEDGNGD
jgi:hypothetical protein